MFCYSVFFPYFVWCIYTTTAPTTTPAANKNHRQEEETNKEHLPAAIDIDTTPIFQKNDASNLQQETHFTL